MAIQFEHDPDAASRPKLKEQSEVISVRLPVAAIEALDRMAAKEGVKRGAVVKRIIKLGIRGK